MIKNEPQRGDRIKYLREEVLKISQKAFSDAISLNQSHLSGIENNKRPVSTTIIDLLYERYSVSSDWLLFGEGEVFAKSLSELSKSSTNHAYLNPDFLRTHYKMDKKSKQTVDFFPLSTTEIKTRINSLARESHDMAYNLMDINKLILITTNIPYNEELNNEDDEIAFGHLRYLLKNIGKSPLDNINPNDLWSYYNELENRYKKLVNRFFERFLILRTAILEPEKVNELKAKYEESEGK